MVIGTDSLALSLQVVLFGEVNPTGAWSSLTSFFSWTYVQEVIALFFMTKMSIPFSLFFCALPDQEIWKHSVPILLKGYAATICSHVFRTTSTKHAISNCYHCFSCSCCSWYMKITKNIFYYGNSSDNSVCQLISKKKSLIFSSSLKRTLPVS